MADAPNITTQRTANDRAGREGPSDVGGERVPVHPVLAPPPARAVASFRFNSTALSGFQGEPVAAALLAHGIRTLRHAPSGAPRGAYCFIGHCFECRVTIDGRSHERACLTPLHDGMEVTSGDG